MQAYLSYSARTQTWLTAGRVRNLERLQANKRLACPWRRKKPVMYTPTETWQHKQQNWSIPWADQTTQTTLVYGEGGPAHVIRKTGVLHHTQNGVPPDGLTPLTSPFRSRWRHSHKTCPSLIICRRWHDSSSLSIPARSRRSVVLEQTT